MAQKLDPVPLAAAKPGISKRLSKLSLGDRWIDGDKVRMVDGLPEKIGGWTKKTVVSVTDPIRGVLAWTTMDLSPLIGLGTHRKLYIADQALDPVDITPVESTGTIDDPFEVTLGSSTVIYHSHDELGDHTPHGRSVGDEVRFSGASEIAGTGMTIDGAYTVTSIIDEDHFTFEHSVVAVDNGTGGGTVTYEYELPIGASDPLDGDGFGAGGYGLGDYGTPSEEGGSIVFDPRVWCLDRYGDLMLANPVNGGIYKFDPSATPAYQRATALTNAPTVCRAMFVTRERFIFALGVDNDPMKIKWPDQDDPTNWTPGPTSTANERRLSEGTRISGGAALANLLSGVWTDTALHQFQYTGSSFVYDSKCVGTNCGLVSPMALMVNLSIAYWASQNGFFMWAGGAPQSIPNVADIQQFVARAMRTGGYEFKCNGYFNTSYNEMWWFFANTSQTEPGIYVAVSLDDFSWVTGTMERTCGTFFKSSDQRPILAGADGYLYQHEDGLDADGAIMQAYIERAPLQLGNGSLLGEVTGFINDMQRQTGSMSIDIKTYDRIDEGVLDRERVMFEVAENLVDLRIGGRIASVIIRSEALGGDFRLGAPMLEVSATGARR